MSGINKTQEEDEANQHIKKEILITSLNDPVMVKINNFKKWGI